MNDYINNFLKGNVLSEKDILKILGENNINGKILNINYSFFKKVYIKIENEKKVNHLKLCLDNYSISLAKNEAKGYLLLNKFYENKFNLIDYKMIAENNNYALAKMKFINGKKSSYFEFKNFYNYNYLNNLNTIPLKAYINKIKDKYNFDSIVNLKNELFEQSLNNFIIRSENVEIPIDVSHGDFIHYNTFKDAHINYVFDLEFFQADRSFLYDYFHWYLTPIFTNSITLRKNFNLFSSIYPIIFKLLNFNLMNNIHNYKNIFENNNLFNILLILFLFEKSMILTRVLNLKNLNELIDENQKNLTKKHISIICNTLIKLTKKI
jgi:hypothetical protein